MLRSDEIIQAYATNTWLIGQLTTGMNHEDSLLQPPFPTNCMNWILGHILVSRDESIQLCGGKLLDQQFIERYKSDSQPIGEEADDIRLFEELLENIRTSQEMLKSLLSNLRENELSESVETTRGEKPRWQHIRGLHWHETYHMGQLELLQSFIRFQRDNMV